MHHLLEVWFSWVLNGGYIGIIVLMAMASSPLPVPAEVVIPPAAFLAAQGRFSLAGVVLAGTLGSYLGATAVYWVSRWIGRPLVLKFGRFVLLTPKKLENAERWLSEYEAGGVFFARILPIVRHLISIPAGVVRMNFLVFTLTTLAGSAVTCLLLAYIGRQAYHVAPGLLNDPEALVHFVKSQFHWILLIVVVFAVLYFVAHWLMHRPRRGNV